jgi:hypothetical protein
MRLATFLRLLGFPQYLPYGLLDAANASPFLLVQKPFIQLGTDALMKHGQANNTNNYVKPKK